MVFSKLKKCSEMVMFSHTLFSLPFALISMLFAAHGVPSYSVVFWIIAAFLGARTGANALNRIIDSQIDAKNPRTAGRHIPKGLVKKSEAVVLTIISFALFIFSATRLNPLCVKLLPVAIFLFVIYSYTKRFTWGCHLILGITCAGAPVGAWIAVAGNISFTCLVLGAANALWVAGFDIIYGTQDVDFDREQGLYSIPAVFGVENALIISSVFHSIAIIFLILIYFLMHLSIFYVIGVIAVTILLVIEHRLVTPDNLNSVKIASYGINQLVSIVFLIFTTADIFLMR
jgi:4-hydroxybenzoate polyprenyltransferase